MGRALVPKTSFSRFESCHPCQSFLKSEHGIAVGASGFQPDDASSTLAARSIFCRKGGVRIGAVPRIASPEARVQFPYSAPDVEVGSQDSKASACKAGVPSERGFRSLGWKADHAGVQFSPPPPEFVLV